MKPNPLFAQDPSPGSPRHARLLWGVLAGVGVALLALYLAVFLARTVSVQWDLRTYLAAARAASSGLDPYLPHSLASLTGRETFPFVYPAVTLLLFSALTAIPSAAAVWMGTKALLLAGLVIFWARRFVPHAGILAIALVAVFGWNGAALWDLRSGNVALLECALLWAAFACFVSGQRTAFAALTVIAACFKLLPAVFLLLLLVPTERGASSPLRLVASLGALAILVLGPMWLGPAARWESFLGHVPAAALVGDANPSAHALATALLDRAGIGGPMTAWLPAVIWVAYASCLLFFSAPLLRDAWRRKDPTHWAMLAVLLYALLSPRPMAYGYLLLVPVPFYFAPRPFHTRTGQLLLALALSAQGIAWAARYGSDDLLFVFAPFLLTLCLWGLVVNAQAVSRRSGRLPAGEDHQLVHPGPRVRMREALH